MKELLYYIGWLLFIGSIISAATTFFSLDPELFNQSRLLVITPILIPGLGFGALLLGVWKIIEINEKKLMILERHFKVEYDVMKKDEWEG